MTNLVSVYLPTKNRVSLLRRAVNSVLTQTVRNIELIIVSDGSEDETCDFVRSIKSDISVRLIHNERSLGACNARNQAIEVAQGKFITGLDDDDSFAPHRIESFLKSWTQLESNSIKFSCLFDTCVVDNGSSIAYWHSKDVVNPEEILFENGVGNQVFTKRDRLIKAGLFDPKMPAWQDWDLWTRLLNQFGPAKNIHANSYFVDESHEYERITLKSSEKIKAAAQLFYAKHCDKRHLAAVLHTLGYYPQVQLTVNDLYNLLLGMRLKSVIRKLIRGQYIFSFTSSILSRR